MKPRMLSDVVEVTGGRLVGSDVEIAGVSTDSRSVTPGALFAALPGERADGHDHVAEAVATGAAAALVTRQVPDVAQIVVDDVLEALQRLAADERRRAGATVVGVTGSSGKTLTKDLIAAAAGAGRSVHAATGSFNNELGLPLTLLGAPEGTEVIVAEMGARGVGHIAELCSIASPDIGVVTNIGVAHLELFGSPEAVAIAKGELVEALPSGGLAVLNQDDPRTRDLTARTTARVVSVGVGEDADLRAEYVELDDMAVASFTVALAEPVTMRMPLPGEHMVHNALAALAVALDLGVDPAAAAAAIEAAPTSGWRMQVHDTLAGVRVINDAYNANPSSMAAALKAARWVARDRRLIAVLGTMRELGERSFEEHERVGELAARLRVEQVLTVGEEAHPIARAAIREGVEPANVHEAADVDEAASILRDLSVSGDVILLKGSRAVGLERLAEVVG